MTHVDSRFLAGGASNGGEAAPGDHLQTGYRLWLVGDQLEHGRAPWRDPYSFQPESKPTLNFGGWPYGLPYWPLVALFGPVLAWNLFILLTYVGAGGVACAWLRELGLPSGAALAGGLVFAIAPYRAAQSAGHPLGPIALLLPLALWAFERVRRGGVAWGAVSAASLASIPLSGQVHLALGAIPFFAAYALVRTRGPRALVVAAAAVAAAVAAGLLVQELVIAKSISAGGRSLREVAKYSADWLDLVTRHRRHGNEQFVFIGWLTPVLALAGLALLARARRLALAAVLALGALVPILLALGTNLPLYRTLYHAFRPLRYPRVPERLMPVACLALAALVAFGVARLRPRLAPALALLALFLDLQLGVRVYGASAADPHNRAYAAIAGRGRILELPVFRPGRHYAGVYDYYDMQARRQHPGGYSTLAPKIADRVARELLPLNCGSARPLRLAAQLGVRYVLVHGGFYDKPQFGGRRCERRAVRMLSRRARLEARGGRVTLYRLTFPLRGTPSRRTASSR